jgi:hypothetical protein
LLAESIDTDERSGSILLSNIHSSTQSVERGRRLDSICSIELARVLIEVSSKIFVDRMLDSKYSRVRTAVRSVP